MESDDGPQRQRLRYRSWASAYSVSTRLITPPKLRRMAEGGGSNGAEGSSAARGRWNALAENSRQRRPKGVEGTVRFRTSFHNVVYDVFRARAWKETDSDVDWDVCWADTGAPRE